MRKLFFIILILLFSCKKQDNYTQSSEAKLRFYVNDVSSIRAKSLINNPDHLTLACTPSDETYQGKQGEGKSIGFFVDRYHYEGANIIINSFNDVYTTELKHKRKDENNEEWNYFPLEDQEWVKGDTYHIRAFYPKYLVDESNLIPSSRPRDMAMNYNTHHYQEDFLVAYNQVHTTDPVTDRPSICYAYDNDTGDYIESQLTGDGYGYDQAFDLNEHIPLFFKHTLAAIRVRFRFNYVDENLNESDQLLNCFFSNKDNTTGLHTIGTLIYGESADERPDNREDLEEAWKTFEWISSQSMLSDIQYFTWGVADDGEGVPFGRTLTTIGDTSIIEDRMAVAYTKYQTLDCQTITKVGSNPAVVTNVHTDTDYGIVIPRQQKDEPPYYDENDGWVLIIPQKAPKSLYFNFRTKNGGFFSELVPPFTQTTYDVEDGLDPNYHLKPDSNCYKPGYRYTYTLTVNKTDVAMSLTVEDWNELYASEFILF